MKLEYIKDFFNKYIIYILIFCFAFGLRLYCIEHKDFFHHDEPFSFVSSTPSNMSPDGVVLKKQWDNYNFNISQDYKISDINKFLFENKASLKSVFQDLSALRNANIDHQHPILYYSLFRIYNSGYDGLGWQEGIYRGCFFNLILFSLSFFFLYKLLNLIKPNDKKFIGLGLFFASCCTAGLSNTLLIREYSIAGLFFVICAYLTLLICKDIIDNKNMSWKKVIFLSFVYSLLTQTGYFSFLFNLILITVLIYYSFYFKRYNYIKKILSLFFLSFVWILVIYPDYFVYMFQNEYSNDVLHSVLNLQHFSIAFNSFLAFCGDYVIYKYVFLFAILLLILNFSDILKTCSDKNFEKNEMMFLLTLLIPAVIWNIYIILISPIGPLKFSLPVVYLTSLILVLLTYRFKKIYTTAIVLMFLYFSLMPVMFKDFRTSKIAYLHYDPEQAVVENDINLDKYLDQNILSESKIKNFNNIPFKINSEIPVVIVLPKYYFPVLYYSMLDNNGILRFENKAPDTGYKYNKFILFTPYIDENKLPYKVKDLLYYNDYEKRSIYYVEIK